MGIYKGGSKVKPDEAFIREFRELGGFSNKYKFKRSSRVTGSAKYKIHWWVECPKCREDEYSGAGFPYVFEDSASRLRKGLLSCRCSKSYQRTSEEYFFEIEKILYQTEPCATIITPKGAILNASTKIEWLCEYKHTNNTLISNIRKHGFSCNCCRLHDSRYKKRLEGTVSYLYLIQGVESGKDYVKLGMTNKLYGRRGRLSHFTSTSTDMEVISLYTGDYESIFKLESLLHKHLHLKFGQLPTEFTITEYYNKEDVKGIEDYVKAIVDSCDEVCVYNWES